MLSALWLPAASCERHENTLTSRLRLCQGARSPLQPLGSAGGDLGTIPKPKLSAGRAPGAAPRVPPEPLRSELWGWGCRKLQGSWGGLVLAPLGRK